MQSGGKKISLQNNITQLFIENIFEWLNNHPVYEGEKNPPSFNVIILLLENEMKGALYL